MPAGSGSYGRHGIWEFGENDSFGPGFSDTLNRLSSSIQTALDDRDDDRATVTATRTAAHTITGAWSDFPWQEQQVFGTGLTMPVNGNTVTATRPMLVQISMRIRVSNGDGPMVAVAVNGGALAYAQDYTTGEAAGAALTVGTTIPLQTGDKLTTAIRLYTGTSAPVYPNSCFMSVVELRSLA